MNTASGQKSTQVSNFIHQDMISEKLEIASKIKSLVQGFELKYGIEIEEISLYKLAGFGDHVIPSTEEVKIKILVS